MSPVATIDRETPPDAPGRSGLIRRTAAQPELVAKHISLVQRQYVDMNADPVLVALLLDETILGTPEIAARLGYKRSTRVFQFYSAMDDLRELDQLPHPTAPPEPDVILGKRGASEIRGIMAGRFNLWCLQSGRWHWDSINRRLVKQTGINHGGAPRRA